MGDLDLSQLFDGMDFSISQDALQSLMKNIMKGYKRYIIGNGILHLDKIGFDSYMESDIFKQILAESMGELLDTSGMQQQFTEALQKNLQTVMEQYSAQIGQQVMQQIGDKISDQLSGELGQQLAQQLGTALQAQLAEVFQSQMGTMMETLLRQLLSAGRPDGKRVEDRCLCLPECSAAEYVQRRADRDGEKCHQRLCLQLR